MPSIEALGDQGFHGTSIYVEDWPHGQKMTVTASAQDSAAFPGGAVQVKNLTDKRIWVRADGLAAADDGMSDPLDPNDSEKYPIQSLAGTISVLGSANNVGAVYLMPMKGRR